MIDDEIEDMGFGDGEAICVEVEGFLNTVGAVSAT